MFLGSSYRSLTGDLAKRHPERVAEVLNFESAFRAVEDDNVRPLLARHDRFVRCDRQRGCYGDRPIRVLEKGHVTAALAAASLRAHVLEGL